MFYLCVPELSKAWVYVVFESKMEKQWTDAKAKSEVTLSSQVTNSHYPYAYFKKCAVATGGTTGNMFSRFSLLFIKKTDYHILLENYLKTKISQWINQTLNPLNNESFNKSISQPNNHSINESSQTGPHTTQQVPSPVGQLRNFAIGHM